MESITGSAPFVKDASGWNKEEDDCKRIQTFSGIGSGGHHDDNWG